MSGDGGGLSSRQARRLLGRYRVTDGDGFALKHHDPAETGGLDFGKDDGERLLADGVRRLAELQARLWAERRQGLVCVLQAMDAGGKDGTVKHVLSGVNPQGVRVVSFRAPGPEELAHDFLWRIHKVLPPRGSIGILNRSHYEEVVTVRVHPELLDAQRLPGSARDVRHFWRHRLHDIAAFEAYLARQGFAIIKFFLNISPDEQRRRLLARLDEPDKHWKWDAGDLRDRARWDDYMDAYEKAIAATAAPHAPWYVVPADHKWFAHLVVAAALIETLERLDPAPPPPTEEQLRAIEAARRELGGL